MECNNLEYRRRLPPELLTEMHKCLPLDNAIYVLVNVSNTFVINNSIRMHRTIQRIKTSLKEHIDTLVEAEEQIDDEEENDPEKLEIYNEIKWKPQMDALLRYGSWLTSIRKLYSHRIVGGIPENFVEKLLLHLANSSFTQMMLQIADIHFVFGTKLPTPTFLWPLFNEKQFRVGNRFVFEFVELKVDNGQTIYIHDGELIEYWNGECKLRLFVMNKMNGNEWFEITIGFGSSKEFIRQLEFKQWKMQSLVNKFIQFGNSFEEKDGNTLEAKRSIFYNPNLDLFLRRGAKFTQFRHLKINQWNDYFCCPDDYIDFLINFVSNAKHPEEFLESIDFGLFIECSSSIKNLWEIFPIEIPKSGKFVHFGEKKLYILSAKRIWLKVEDSSDDSTTNEEQKLKFTLANLPTNGKYLFDVCVKIRNGLKQIFGIKIQKRKNDQIIELNCNDQIAKKKLGMKRKAENDDGEDENMPTCSSKILKK